MTNAELNKMRLHELLELGLADLKKQEETPGCVVDMGVWLQTCDFGDGKVCGACLAGSVLKHTLDQNFYVDWLRSLPDDDDDVRWMDALDNLRQGWVSEAAGSLDLSGKDYGQFNIVTPSYKTARELWWAATRELVGKLKAANL